MDERKTNERFSSRAYLLSFLLYVTAPSAATPGVAPRGGWSLGSTCCGIIGAPCRASGGAPNAPGGTPNPPAAMPCCMNPKNCLAACIAAAAAGSCVPGGTPSAAPGATPPATAGRAGVGFATSAGGANALGAAGAEGVAAVPGAGAENAPPGPPTEGGFMAARTSAAPDARPFFPEHARTCQGAKRFLSSGPKVAQTSRALDARASRLAHPARSSFPETSVPVVRSARRARRAGRVARARGRRAWTRASQRFAAHARKRAGLLNPRINRRTFTERGEFRADRARDRGGWGDLYFWPNEKSRA